MKSKIRNPNHPKKGSKTCVEPIRNLADIRSITKLISNNPRNHLLFVLGTNSGIRIGDLIGLKYNDVKDLKLGASLRIIENKTKKPNVIVINKKIYKALRSYIDKISPKDVSYLFQSRKGKRPLTIQAVNNLIKKWTKEINLKGNYGAHSLRKSWGYHQRVHFGVGFEVIAKRFNHSNPAVTMRYLGIHDKEILTILNNDIG